MNRHGAIVCLVLLTPCVLGARGAASQQRDPTPESGIGVWYQPGAPAERELWRPGDAGQRLLLRLRVLDTSSAPVAGALVEMWHADAGGEVHANRYRTALLSDADGSVRVSTVLPGYIWGPRHVHVMVSHPRHATLITRLFFKRDPAVAQSGRPELAIHLEDGRYQGEAALFGDVEMVLRGRS